MTALDEGTRELLTACGGPGGGVRYIWGGPSYGPVWFPSRYPPKLFPDYWPAVYWCPQVSIRRLPGKQRGGIDNLLFHTCLYADFDLKLGRTWADVQALDPAPSAIVATGGGFHLYWFLVPILIDDQNRDELNRIQHRWTAFTGGDPGASDIARVLRLPGSLNRKYNPARKVELLHLDTHLRYDLRDLARLLPTGGVAGGLGGNGAHAAELADKAPGQKENSAIRPNVGHGLRQFDPEFWLTRALSYAAPGSRNKVGYWLACRLAEHGASQSEALGVLERYQKAVDKPTDRYSMQECKDAVKSAFRAARRETVKSRAS